MGPHQPHLAVMHASHENEYSLSIQDLPPECLALILGALEKNGDRSAASEVCRAWKHVDDYTRASLTLSLSHWHKEVAPSAALARLLQRFQNLTSLNLWYIELSPDFLDVLATDCQNITKLCMRMCRGFGLDTARPLLQALTTLQLIRLSELTDAGLVNLTRSSNVLQELSIEGCSLLTDESLAILKTQCPSLRTLRLGRLYGVLGEGIAAGCPHLLHLDCTATNISAVGLQAICEGCPDLLELVLFTSGLHRSSDYEAIGSCKRLQKLVLHQPRALRDTAVVVILKKCKDLKTLHLPAWSCQDLSNIDLPVHTNLTDLDLSFSVGLGVQKLQQFVGKLFPSLQRLEVTGVKADWKFDDMKEQLKKLSPSCEVLVW